MEVDREIRGRGAKTLSLDPKNHNVEQSKGCEIDAQHQFQFVPEGCVS